MNYQKGGRGHNVVIVDVEKDTYTANVYDTYEFASEVSQAHHKSIMKKTFVIVGKRLGFWEYDGW